MDLSIIIPIYNEEKILKDSIDSTIQFFSDQNITWKLIIVNDGSTDTSHNIANKIAVNNNNLLLLDLPKNLGKGNAVREGFLRSTGDYILFFDIDLSTPLSTFNKFWEKRSESKIIIGSRGIKGSVIKKHQKILKELAGLYGNMLTRLLLPLPFKDTQCGFKMFPGSFRKLIHLSSICGAAFDVEYLLIAVRNGYAIEEVAIEWTNRPESKFGLSHYPLALLDLFKIVFSNKRNKYNLRQG